MSYDSPTATATRSSVDTPDYPVVQHGPSRRQSTETKASFKTTEFFVYILAVAGVLVASLLVKTGANHADYFRADKAWFYIVLLSLGYMGSRGLAKSGSRDHYDA